MADMDDNTSDAKCLVHLQTALKELILALNMEPDSWTIACAIQNVQGAVDDMRWDIKMDQNYPDRQDEKMETPAITEAAMATLRAVQRGDKREDAGSSAVKRYFRKF